MYIYKTILISSLFVFFACSSSKENNQDNASVTSNKQDSILENQDFYYHDDASSRGFDTEEDTLYNGYMKSKAIDTASFVFNLKPNGNYNNLKSQIKTERLRLSKLYLSKKDSVWQMRILDSARNYITSTLINKIIPHWYGMPWDMSGYSAIPQKGEVGCSYFVSNTLLHMGFNVNRYRLAQQGPENEAKSIDKNYKHYTGAENLEYNKMNKALLDKIVKENKPGLYFVGVSSHVGYLLIHKNDLFFIQSNYGDLKVMLEYAETSEEFIDSQYFLANITYNDNLIRKWLLNEKVKVILD